MDQRRSRGAAPVSLRSSFSRTLDRDRDFRQRGDTLLDEDKRQRLRAYVRERQGDLPGLPRLSKEADNSWRERVEARLPETLHIPKFEELYTEIYDQFATFDHPSTLGLQVFVHTEGDPVVATVDGEPEREREMDLRPYWLAVFAFAEALVVSHLASGRLRLQSLQRNLGTIGTMRELERAGPRCDRGRGRDRQHRRSRRRDRVDLAALCRYARVRRDCSGAMRKRRTT